MFISIKNGNIAEKFLELNIKKNLELNYTKPTTTTTNNDIKKTHEKNTLLANLNKNKEIYSKLNENVGGLDDVIKNLVRKVLLSRSLNSKTMRGLGVTHVKGFLLYGPPGFFYFLDFFLKFKVFWYYILFVWINKKKLFFTYFIFLYVVIYKYICFDRVLLYINLYKSTIKKLICLIKNLPIK
jgi:hypothetical protein